jgi:N-methylhydantoinase A
MAAAVRMHVTEQGGDPARATIIAFGGAGPVHVFNLARKLGVRQMLVPLRPGVLSALGLLIAPPAYDIVRTHKVPLAQADADLIGGHLREMTDDIHQTLQEVEAEGEVALAYALDIGYIGQGYQVAVALDGSDVAALDPQSLWDRFAEIYRAKYGYFYDDVPIEIVNLRASGRIPGGQHRLRPLEMGSGSVEDARTGERPAYSPAAGEMIACAVYRRERLGPGAAFTGPAIIEEPSATTIVDTRARVQVDAYGSLLIELD